jgi:phosphate:Na+ symporter
VSNPLANPELWFGLFGGLALFLFGMDIMTRALKRATGKYLKTALARLTQNRFVAAGMGALVTSIIQSSSVTTVILVGFVSAGLLSMSQSIAVIMGANIGTTITAQILAFKVTTLALPIITLGFLVSFTAKRDKVQQYGMMLLGLGLIFYGMSVMSGSLHPLRVYEPFIEFMTTMQNPFFAVLAGAAFTAIVQSSSATTGVLIVMASQGLIRLEPAIAIALGANIGTCITAGLAAIGKPRGAVRAATVHILFNVAGVLLWIAFIPQLAEIARTISPTYEVLTGAARSAAETPRQIANMHMFFNLINTMVFIGFTTQIARLVEWMIPDRPLSESQNLEPKFLDEMLLSTPVIALAGTRREVVRMGEWVYNMFIDVLPAVVARDVETLRAIEKKDHAVDSLHREIIGFLAKISNKNLSPDESGELMELIQIANDLEYVADRIAADIVTSARKSLNEGVIVSDQTAAIITEFHKEIAIAFDRTLKSVTHQDRKLANKVRARKRTIAEFKRKIAVHGINRLTANAPKRRATYSREIETVEILDGIFKIVRRIAGTQKHQRN